MPWASKAQAAWGHSPSGLRALGGKDKVDEWDDATPKGSLPPKVGAIAKVKKVKPVKPVGALQSAFRKGHPDE